MELTRCALFRQPSTTERLLVADGAVARCGRSGSSLRTDGTLIADGRDESHGRTRCPSRTSETSLILRSCKFLFVCFVNSAFFLNFAADMTQKALLLVIMMALWLGCGGSKGDAVEETNGITEDSMMLANGYTALDLHKIQTGHITVWMNVNGKPCVFLVDTGGGATLIDKNRRRKYGLETTQTANYATGIGSVESLVATKATFQVNGIDIDVDYLYLMDIAYINKEFRKNHASQVDGVLGTDFLDRHAAVIDYGREKMYLRAHP